MNDHICNTTQLQNAPAESQQEEFENSINFYNETY